MPALELNIFNQINQDNIFLNYPIFVETGTFMGETIFLMSKYFKELHTIEIKQDFYTRAKSLNISNNINFYLGDSSKEIINICNNIKDNTVFFLDGHWSAGNTGKGEKDCPLYEELKEIMKHLIHKAIIIIDDTRLFGLGPNKSTEICNWEDINVDTILKITKNRLTNHYFLDSACAKNDRLILHLNNIS